MVLDEMITTRISFAYSSTCTIGPSWADSLIVFSVKRDWIMFVLLVLKKNNVSLISILSHFSARGDIIWKKKKSWRYMYSVHVHVHVQWYYIAWLRSKWSLFPSKVINIRSRLSKPWKILLAYFLINNLLPLIST